MKGADLQDFCIAMFSPSLLSTCPKKDWLLFLTPLVLRTLKKKNCCDVWGWSRCVAVGPADGVISLSGCLNSPALLSSALSLPSPTVPCIFATVAACGKLIDPFFFVWAMMRVWKCTDWLEARHTGVSLSNLTVVKLTNFHSYHVTLMAVDNRGLLGRKLTTVVLTVV